MKKTLIIVLAASLGLNYYLLRPYICLPWYGYDYDRVVVNKDILLTAEGTNIVVGMIKKGAALHVLTKDDPVSVIPNPTILKLYVDFPEDLGESVLYDPADSNEISRIGEVHDIVYGRNPAPSETNNSPNGGVRSQRMNP